MEPTKQIIIKQNINKMAKYLGAQGALSIHIFMSFYDYIENNLDKCIESKGYEEQSNYIIKILYPAHREDILSKIQDIEKIWICVLENWDFKVQYNLASSNIMDDFSKNVYKYIEKNINHGLLQQKISQLSHQTPLPKNKI